MNQFDDSRSNYKGVDMIFKKRRIPDAFNSEAQRNRDVCVLRDPFSLMDDFFRAMNRRSGNSFERQKVYESFR